MQMNDVNKQLLSGLIHEWNVIDTTRYNVVGGEYLRY